MLTFTISVPLFFSQLVVANLNDTEKSGILVNGAAGIPRINWPAYQWWSEALHGTIRSCNIFIFRWETILVGEKKNSRRDLCAIPMISTYFAEHYGLRAGDDKT